MLPFQDNFEHAGERRLAAAMRAAAPAVWDYDIATGRFIASAEFNAIYGWPEDKAPSVGEFLDATHPKDCSWTEVLKGAGDPSALTNLPYRYRIYRASDGKVRWIGARTRATYSAGGKPIAFTGTIEDITEETHAADAAFASDQRLRLAVEAGKLAVWDVDVETGALSHSPELNLLCGFPPEARPSFDDIRALYAPGEKERLDREGATVEVIRALSLEGAMPAGRAADAPSIQAEVSIVTPAGEGKRLLLRAVYAPTPDGTPRVTGVLVDITERKRAEEQLATVARELQHRVKNSLALVQAIAMQTFRGSADTPTAMRAFLGRLKALGAATDLVLDRDTSETDIGDIVESIVAPYRHVGADPFTLGGPAIRIESKVANAIAMIVHELATNSLKYGSLSREGGRVALAWGLLAGGRIALDWEEMGGPPVSANSVPGFGTRLINGLAAGDLGGTAEITMDPAGLRCRIVTAEGVAQES